MDTIRLVADSQNRLFWCAGSGGASECCIPSTGWKPGIPKWATIVLAQAEPTVLQTLPRDALTTSNTAGAPELRTYLARDKSRHHRPFGPIAPWRAGLARPRAWSGRIHRPYGGRLRGRVWGFPHESPGLLTWSEIWCDVENSKSFRSSCDRRVFPGHRLRGASALHNYLALIFHCSGRDDTEQYAGKHQKEPGHELRDTPSPGDYVRSPGPCTERR